MSAREAIAAFVAERAHMPRSTVGRMLADARELGSTDPARDVVDLVCSYLAHASDELRETAEENPRRAVAFAWEIIGEQAVIEGYEREDGAGEYDFED